MNEQPKPVPVSEAIQIAIKLHQRGELAEAENIYRKILQSSPSHFDAMHMLGVVRVQRGRPDEGEQIITKALKLNPQNASAYNNRANALFALGRYDEAIESVEQALVLKPNYAEAQYTRGLTNLMYGRFKQGWIDFDARWNTKRYPAECRPNLDHTKFSHGLDRAAIKGKRVLVVAEQGIGDEIMFASMLPELMRDAKTVAVECDRRLASLFARSFPGIGLIARELHPKFNTDEFDFVMPEGSLGRIYRNSFRDFPSRESFLVPDQALVAKWKKRLAPLGPGLNVGIAWRGGTAYTRREVRSIDLERLMPIVSVPGVNFVSLQYGNVDAEIEAANKIFPKPIARFNAAELDDFDQLAGLVKALDLVISVQMTICQLTGAVGKRCWVMVAYTPEWRYGTDKFPMPWYNTVIRYRQRVRGEWDETILRVADELAHFVKYPATP